MVPTFLRYDDPARKPGSSADLFWRKLVQQTGNHMGFWVASPDGKILESMYHEIDGQPTASRREGTGPGWNMKSFSQAAQIMVASALHKFGPVELSLSLGPARDPFGLGFTDSGGASLISYPGWVRNGRRWNGAEIGDGFGVSITFSKAELQTFHPPQLTLGTRWTLPDDIARRFVSGLQPDPDTALRPRAADDSVKNAEIIAEVEAVQGDKIIIRLTASWHVNGRYDGTGILVNMRGDGIAVYEHEEQRLQSITLIALGRCSGRNLKNHSSCAVIRWKAR